MIESKTFSDIVVFGVVPVLATGLGYVAADVFFPEDKFAPLFGSALGLIVSGVGIAGYVKHGR